MKCMMCMGVELLPKARTHSVMAVHKHDVLKNWTVQQPPAAQSSVSVRSVRGPAEKDAFVAVMKSCVAYSTAQPNHVSRPRARCHACRHAYVDGRDLRHMMSCLSVLLRAPCVEVAYKRLLRPSTQRLAITLERASTTVRNAACAQPHTNTAMLSSRDTC